MMEMLAEAVLTAFTIGAVFGFAVGRHTRE